MMKKILTIAMIAGFSTGFSQLELRIHNGSSAMINGTTITVTDTLENDMAQDIPVEIDVKSTYAASKTIRVKKIEC